MKHQSAFWTIVSTGVVAASALQLRTVAVASARPVNPVRTGVGPVMASTRVRPSGRVETSTPRMLEAYGKLPLSFEANRGQTDSRVKFLSRGSGYTVFLTSTEAVLALQQPSRVSKTRPNIDQVASRKSSDSSVLRMKLLGAQAPTTVEGLKELTGKSNYFIGNDAAKWQTQVPTYAQVRYQNAYPGIDLVYYGQQGQLEFDFVVAPRASVTAIRLAIEGTDAPVQIDRRGDLIVTLDGGQVCLHKPVVYQPTGMGRVYVDGRYVLKSAHEVGFEIAAADPTRPVVIDPTLSYSTYVGGSSDDVGSGIAVDSAGTAYVTGFTSSIDFPTASPLQPTNHGGVDAFVAALDATGSTLRYATYLGGSGLDFGFRIAVDSAGNAYVTGDTDSTDFPTKNPLQPTSHGKGDAFVAALDPTGSTLRYATYLGGSDSDGGGSIAVDSAGNAYVTGFTYSTDFPTKNPLQPTNHSLVNTNAFVAALDPTGSTLRYATYLGGSGAAGGFGIAVDSVGNAYVTGGTDSTDFPTKNPFQPTSHGGLDAFVAALDATGSTLRYATYLGGSGSDSASGIAVDSAGNAYVTGYTASTDFPTRNPLQPTNHGGLDAFVAALDPTGSTLRYATYLGGSGLDDGNGIAVDTAGNAYVTGSTDSTDFPTKNSLQPTNHEATDAFVAALDPTGSTLRYATYLGGSGSDFGNGIAVDSAGSAYVTGDTSSIDFPTASPLQPTSHGGHDAFVVKITSGVPPSITSLTATPNILWPPNHKMVPVSLTVSASGMPVPSCGISAVSSNDSPSVPGETDWVVTGPLTLNLRAERPGSGDGRIYTITITCSNGIDPSASQSVTVSVPHDQGR